MAQKFTQSGVMRKPNSDFSFDNRVVRIVFNVIEFRCSELGDSSWNRILITLALKEHKEPVSNMETRHWKINIANCSLVTSVNRLVGMKMPYLAHFLSDLSDSSIQLK